MLLSWLSLVPPLAVVAAVLLTQRLNLSLILGIVIAAVIATDGSLIGSGHLIIARLWQQVTNIDALLLYAFLITISSFICLLNYTGGAVAFAQLIIKRLRSAKMVETATMLLSSALCIDDYLSTLTTGYVMRPMTDRFHIPRAKLAYIIHALSAPVVILMPVSSWVAMITGQLDQAGITSSLTASAKIIADPFFIYLNAIPFTFYSLFTIASTWIIVRHRLSFGPMHQHEVIAHTQHNLCGGKSLPKEPDMPVPTSGSSSDLFAPLAVLIVGMFIGILYMGNFYWFGGTNGFLEAFQKSTHTELSLCIAGLIMFATACGLALARGTITINIIPKAIAGGIELMADAITMLILVWALGIMLKDDVMTGQYIATTLLSSINSAVLPFMIFCIASLISLITGSSWGTIALLMPIAVPMLTTLSGDAIPVDAASLPLLLPVLGAILSGAVCGDHLSPISATTGMAATAAGSYHMDHVRTQLPYGIPAVISSALAFLAIGFLLPYGIITALIASLALGSICCCTLLYVAQYLYRNVR